MSKQRRQNCLIRVPRKLQVEPAGKWWDVGIFRRAFGLNAEEFGAQVEEAVLEVRGDRCRIAAGQKDYFGFFMIDRAMDGERKWSGR